MKPLNEPAHILAVATLWQEAQNCSPEEQSAVAHVIRNRMRDHYTSDGTVAGTVLVPWQFSGWMNPAYAAESLAYAKGPDPMGLLKVWVESANPPDPTDGAVLYYSPADMSPPGSVPDWVPRVTLTVVMPQFRFYKA